MTINLNMLIDGEKKSSFNYTLAWKYVNYSHNSSLLYWIYICNERHSISMMSYCNKLSIWYLCVVERHLFNESFFKCCSWVENWIIVEDIKSDVVAVVVESLICFDGIKFVDSLELSSFISVEKLCNDESISIFCFFRYFARRFLNHT